MSVTQEHHMLRHNVELRVRVCSCVTDIGSYPMSVTQEHHMLRHNVELRVRVV